MFKPLVGLGLMVVGSVLTALRERRLKNTARPSSKHTPLLVSLGMPIDSTIIKGPTGRTEAGAYYSYWHSNVQDVLGKESRGVCMVELPFHLSLHLIGSPNKSSEKLHFDPGDVLEKVELEGDFPNYFTLYAEKDQQIQARYVFDPKVMAYVVDFCSAYNWEILNDTLYFMSEKELPTFEAVDSFIAAIRPAKQVESDRAGKAYRVSYEVMEGRVVQCPLCGFELAIEKQWLRCPQGHGCLVHGSKMGEIRDGVISMEEKKVLDAKVAQETTKDVTCPYCQAPMSIGNYQHTDALLHLCTKCAYRWIDAANLQKLIR